MDFEDFLMPSIGICLAKVYTYKKWQQQCMSFDTDSWSADKNDYVNNSPCREKK